MRVVLSVAAVLFVCASLSAQAPLPNVVANDNRTPAGTLKDGVLTLQLDIVRAMWHPDADSDPGIDVYAFAEAGRAPSIPGPLVRVPIGTEIRTSIHNRTDSTMFVLGLSGDREARDTVIVQPDQTREVMTHATAAGTFLYFATTKPRAETGGDDRLLAGAFVVDSPGQPVNDRILVILQWITEPRLGVVPGFVGEVNTINGKTWPHTERLDYNLGDTIRWRVINGSMGPHPMHLHGAYFTVLSRGSLSHDELYDAAHRRLAVTERLLPHTTMAMQWTPVHAGNWLYHCHITFHITAHPPLANVQAAGVGMDEMGGLVVGVRVHGPVAADARPRRKIRLTVQQLDSVAGDVSPPFSYSLTGDVAAAAFPGPPIIVMQGQPLAITIVNHAKEPTSVHWHGLEIESFYDGVHGFGGHDTQVAPHIMPNDSFVVQMTPPRAGTFIYHTHYDELRQQGGGLYGAFIVLARGQQWDAAHERVLLLGSGRDTLENIFINGETHPTLRLKSGQNYRIRLININLARPSIIVSLLNGDQPLSWNAVAVDGADLPTQQAGMRPARLQITTGQTADMLLTAPPAGHYLLRITTGDGTVLNTGDIVVDP